VSRPPTGKKTSVNKRGSPMNATECDASDLLALAPRVPPTRIRPRSAPNPPPLNNKPNGLVLLVNLQAREKQKRKTENKSQKTLVAISRVGELTQNFWMSLSKNSKGSRTFSQTRDYTTFGAANRSKILGPVSCLRKQVHAPCGGRSSAGALCNYHYFWPAAGQPCRLHFFPEVEPLPLRLP